MSHPPRMLRHLPVAAAVASLLALFAVMPTVAAPTPARAAAPEGGSNVEIVIESRTLIAGGRSFGEVGQYERLRGYVRGVLDPDDPANVGIVNLQNAPTNPDGDVDYRVDIEIDRPVDPARGNGTMLYDIPNRGYQTMGAWNADGLLYEKGFSVVASGWQGDVASTGTNVVAHLPVATDRGEPIVGPSREEFVDKGTGTWTGSLSYPAATLDRAQATLTVRQHERDERVPVADWRYVDDRTIEVTHPGDPYDSGALFEFIYPATDPIVLGIGFAATRDINSFLRYGGLDSGGNQNPLGPDVVDHTVALGVSQSGRFLHTFLNEGYNADLAGRRVFDGALPIISGSRGIWLDDQFAKPGRYFKQHPGNAGPYSYATVRDPLTGEVGSILAACRETDTCPKVMHLDSENELWNARGSLVVTDGDPDRPRDVNLPDDVRAYFIAGTPHGVFNQLVPPAGSTSGICQQTNSPLGNIEVARALLLRLERWITAGVEPPKSRYGSADSRQLVRPDQSSTGFPDIPGVTYNGAYTSLQVTDYDTVPPAAAGPEYGGLVPRVDRDGNSLAGIRLPALEAPVATYTGWNLRATGHAEGDLCGETGSFVPLAKTRAERLAAGDPRRSIEERYPTHGDYVRRFAKAADSLVRQGYLLRPDADKMIAEADALPIP